MTQTYKELKARARDRAIEFQHNWDLYVDEVDYYSDLYKVYKLGRKYGLLKEFRENGVI